MAFSRLRALFLRFARLVLIAPITRYVVDIIAPKLPKQSRMQSSSRNQEGLKVIACGFCRSGTMSLKDALGDLGFPCYHGIHFFFIPGHAKLWWQIATKGKSNWPQILQGFRAIIDFPAALYYKQLMAQYPDAKVILNVRNPEQWHRSCMDSVIWIYYRILIQIFLTEMERKFIDHVLLGGKFGGRFSDKEFAINVYKNHVEEVKRIVPKEKLLVYEVKEGWAPLCDFLQVDIPTKPFPMSNDTSYIRRRIKIREREYIAFSAVCVGLMSVAIAFLLKWASQVFVES